MANSVGSRKKKELIHLRIEPSKSDKKKTMCNFDEFYKRHKRRCFASKLREELHQFWFSLQDTDIHVGSDHPVHRRSPFTQQSRGCGLKGDHISFPYHFFTNWNVSTEIFGDPAKVFAHEWSKYRYGIFDEFGYENDKLFPHFYKVNGEILPTGSSDTRIKGSWRKELSQACDPSIDQKCYFVADINDNNGATCSLGYMGFLPNVNRYCTLNQQWGVNQALAPTKHNVLCQAQGAQEVIQAHPDLNTIPVTAPKQTNFNVTLRAVREPVTKYVLVLESSSSMIKQDLWKWISKAAQKFIRNDLPDETKMAIVTFSNESVIQHSLASLTDEEARARIADSIPDKYKVQRSPDQRCVICGIQTAMRDVLSGEEAGAHVILVTRGDNDTLSLTDENLILEFARYYQVKFSSILVPTAKSLSFYDSLSKLSNGRSFVFQAPEKPLNVGAGLYHNVIEAFYSLRRLDTLDSTVPVTVHSHVVTREVPNLKSSGTFSIDSTLGQETRFGIFVDDPDEHNIRSVTFTDNGGQVYGPYSSLSNEYNVINMKTINFPKDTPVPPFDDVSFNFLRN